MPPVVLAVESLLPFAFWADALMPLAVPPVDALLLAICVEALLPLASPPPAVPPPESLPPLAAPAVEALLSLVVPAVKALPLLVPPVETLPLASAALLPWSSTSCFTVSLSEAAISSPLSSVSSSLESCCPDTATTVS